LKFGVIGEMEFGEMKRNTSNWSNFCMLLLRAGLAASAGLSCLGLFCHRTKSITLPVWKYRNTWRHTHTHTHTYIYSRRLY